MKRGPKAFKKEYLIKKLQTAFTVLGHSPSQSDIKKLPNFPSRNAFRYCFGSFEKAKALAGIPPAPKGMSHPNCYAAVIKYFVRTGRRRNGPRRIRRSITLNLRFKVLHRDNFTCQYCGRTPKDGIKLEVDHIVPRKNAGETVFENLITACSECNEGKKIINLSHLPIKKPKPMNKNSNHQSRLF